MKLTSLCHIPKEIISSENYTKTVTWKLVPGPFAFAKNFAQTPLENEVYEVIYSYQVLAKLSK